MAKTKTGSRKRATKATAADTSPAGDIDLPRAVAGELVAPARIAMLRIGKGTNPPRHLRGFRSPEPLPHRGERETIAAAVLAVFNAEKRPGWRFIDFHLNALDRELPGFAGAKDRRKLELAEAGVFEVRRIANQSRRALDPTYLGDAIDPKVALQEQAETPGGMLMPFEWIIALSPDVEKAVAAMPTADRQDLETVAAVVSAATSCPNREAPSSPIDLPRGPLADALLWIASPRAPRSVMPADLVEGLRGTRTIKPKTADKILRRLRDDWSAGDRDPKARDGFGINDRGRTLAARLREIRQASEA